MGSTEAKIYYKNSKATVFVVTDEARLINVCVICSDINTMIFQMNERMDAIIDND